MSIHAVNVGAFVVVDLTDVPDYDLPDLHADYSGWHFKPESATIRFQFADGEVIQTSFKVRGHRRLKSGALGAQTLDADFGGWRDTEPPEWATEYIVEAVLAVLREVGR